MTMTTEILYREIEPSPSIDAFVRKWAERLDRVSDRVLRCAVTIDVPHRHHSHGRKFHVGVVLDLPGSTLTVNHDPGVEGAHDDVYVAIRDAFRAARRRLEDHVRQVRGDVKNHDGAGA